MTPSPRQDRAGACEEYGLPLDPGGNRRLGEPRAMTTHIALDFRHGLLEPRVEHTPEGPRLSLTRGQEQVVLLLPERALSALWVAVAAGLHGPDPC